MILADADIRFALSRKRLVIDPLLEPIQPASVDLRLGDRLVLPSRGLADSRAGGFKGVIRLPEPFTFKFFSLSPGESIIASTLEWVEIPSDLVGILTGTSSL